MRVNLGDAGTNAGLYASAGWWGVDGFVSRPNDPSGGQACQAVFYQDGNERRVIASRDNRFANNVGALQPGDRAIVSDCDARFFLKKENNELTLYTVNEDDDDSSMIVDLNGKNGAITIVNSDCFINITKDEITLGVNGGGSLIIDKEGVHIAGSKFVAGCASVALGLGASPATTALYGPAGVSGVPSPSVMISPV